MLISNALDLNVYYVEYYYFTITLFYIMKYIVA